MPCHQARIPRPKARGQHYTFAHELLPALFFPDPSGFVTALTQQGDSLLARLWDEAAQPAPGSAADWASELIVSKDAPRYDVQRLPGGATLIVVILPSPLAAQEAYFVGLLLPAPLETSVTTGEFYTLELAQDHHGKYGSMLCGWTERGHVNYGVRCSPTTDAFAAVVRDVRAARAKPVAGVYRW